MKKLYLVDISSLFFRAFYAVRPLTSPKGIPSNAIYGVLTMILKLMKEEKPEYMVFCYDRKEPSFRKNIYTEYKAHRTEMPEDLVPQIPYIKKLADLLGIPAIEVPDYEADDIIGTLTHLGRKHKMEVYIVSGDKDFGQLLEKGVYLFDTMKSIKVDAAMAKEKWGVRPDQMIDYLALTGDSSDNIPGVRGIGPKGAAKLLDEYDNLDGIYKNIDKIKGSTQEKLKLGKDNAYLSQKLVKIVTDIPLEQDLQHYSLKPLKKAELMSLMDELNFKSLGKTFDQLEQSQSEIIVTRGKSALGETPPVVSDTSEAVAVKKSKDATAEIAARAAVPQAESIEISDLQKRIRANETIWGIHFDRGLLLGLQRDSQMQCLRLQGQPQDLGPALAPKNVKWKGFDLKNFWHLIKAEKPEGVWDSMLAAYVVKAGESMEFEQVYTRFMQQVPEELASDEKVLQQHLDLEKILREKVKDIQAEKVLEELDIPLAAVLYHMETRGVKIDSEKLAVQSKELTKEIQSLEKEICKQAGETFNVGSPKQLSQILFEKMNLPKGKKTKTGFSTDNEVLEKLRSKHPIADLILSFRELSKLKSTYVDSLPLMVKADGRIHSTFNQAHTTTGRLSSLDPNLQNIPIRTEKGARVRKAFVAEGQCQLLSVDYSQIELRILAHYSDDKNLCKAFLEDLDIHAATASEVFSVPLKEVTADQRRTAKAINFGIAYGQGAFGLAENLGIGRSEAQEIIKRYFTRFPGVQTYIQDTIAKAQRDFYVETIYGRRRYLDELKSANAMIKKFGERAAINAPIQGTASDIVKKAMIEVEAQVKLPMILQVHDELVFEASPAELEANVKKVVHIMENVAQLKVPLKANYAIGPNWDEAH